MEEMQAIRKQSQNEESISRQDKSKDGSYDKKNLHGLHILPF